MNYFSRHIIITKCISTIDQAEIKMVNDGYIG